MPSAFERRTWGGSLTPYIISYVWYFTVMLFALGRRQQHAWCLVASVPLIGLVLLRGLVGVDTPVYERAIDGIRDVGEYTFTYEPLFEYIALFLAQGFDNSSVVLAILAMLTTVLLYWGGGRLGRGAYLFAFVVIPYFYLDMTMNGLRYGLAFSIIVLGAQFLMEGRRRIYLIFVLVASLIQISGGLLGIMFMLLVGKHWRAFVYTIVFGAASVVFFDDYLLLKLTNYSSFEIQSSAAGLAPFLLSGSILAVHWSDPGVGGIMRRQILMLAALAALAYVLTQFTYAGLRFQQLVLFLICIFIARVIHDKGASAKNATILIVILIGVIGSGLRLKNFYDNFGQGDAPFAPYHFFWER